MDCAGFERRLTSLVAGEVSEVSRDELLAALRSHAATCAECAGCEELLEFLALPSAERDLVEAPGDDYWRDFNRRVRRRVAAKTDAPRRRWWPAAAAAALLLTGAAGFWLLRGSLVEPARDRPVAPFGVEEEAAWSESWSRLEGLMAEASPAELAAALEALPGNGDDWIGAPGAEESWPTGEGGWLFPETEKLDPEARRELLQWLDEEASPERRLTS